MRRLFFRLALLLSLSGNLMLGWSLYRESQETPYLVSLDARYINASINDYATSMNMTPEGAMHSRFPIVARTQNGICVNLALRHGWLGQIQIYCYSEDGELIYKGQR
jgi:hypothetical protein